MSRSRLIQVVTFAAVTYLAIIVAMVGCERWLVYPAPSDSHGDWNASRYGAEDVELISRDGTRLHAWYYPRPEARRTILFFHGNGENVATAGAFVKSLSYFLDADVLNFDYRGYGRSEGKPHERGLVDDAQAALEWLCARSGRSPDGILYVGRSLGGGVAIQTARHHPPQAFVLIGTFSSLVDTSAELYPWLPVRALMRNRFDSLSAIVHCDVPVFQVHGALDRIVAPQLGQKLHAASPSKQKQFLLLPNRGHNNIGLDDYLAELEQFLDSLE